MSSKTEAERAGSAIAGSAPPVFAYEVRREARVVATLSAYQTPTGVTVDSEVFPVTQAADEPGLKRPFTFASVEQARRFADEAIVAFEYLNCTVI